LSSLAQGQVLSVGSRNIMHKIHTRTYVTLSFDLWPWYSTGFYRVYDGI